MTDTDREYLANEAFDGTTERYQATTRVRKRVLEEVPRDIEILAEHHPELLDELRKIVCED